MTTTNTTNAAATPYDILRNAAAFRRGLSQGPDVELGVGFFTSAEDAERRRSAYAEVADLFDGMAVEVATGLMTAALAAACAETFCSATGERLRRAIGSEVATATENLAWEHGDDAGAMRLAVAS